MSTYGDYSPSSLSIYIESPLRTSNDLHDEARKAPFVHEYSHYLQHCCTAFGTLSTNLHFFRTLYLFGKLKDIAAEFHYLGLPYNEWMRSADEFGSNTFDMMKYLQTSGKSERPYYDLSHLKNRIGIIDSTLAFFDGMFNMLPGFGGSYFIERFPFYDKLKDNDPPYLNSKCVEMVYYGSRSLLESLSLYWQTVILLDNSRYVVTRSDLKRAIEAAAQGIHQRLLSRIFGPLMHFLENFKDDSCIFLFPFFVDYALCSPVPHFNYAFAHKGAYRLYNGIDGYYWKDISPASLFWHTMEECNSTKFRDLCRQFYEGNHIYNLAKIMSRFSDIVSLIGYHPQEWVPEDLKYLAWLKNKLEETIGYVDLLNLCQDFIDEWSIVLDMRSQIPWVLAVPPQVVYDKIGMPCVFNLLTPFESKFVDSVEIMIMEEFVNDFIRCHVRDHRRISEWYDYNVLSSKFITCPFKKQGLRYKCNEFRCLGEIPNKCLSGLKCTFEKFLKMKMGISFSQIHSRY